MKTKTVKGLLAASALLAAGFAQAEATIADSAELTGRALDTRTGVRKLSSPRVVLPFAFVDGGTITVTRTEDGSTETLNGAVAETVQWKPTTFGTYAATNGELSATLAFDQISVQFSFDNGDEYEWQKDAEIRPTFTLRDVDYVLQETVDYTAVYSDNDRPGTGKVTITGVGDYALMGTVVKTFKIVFHPYSVSDSTLADRELDTRETGESRILNGVAELEAFAYNNVPGWPKGGDAGADAATVRMTPMIGVAGGVRNWFPAGVPATLATVAGEATLNWAPADGYTAYKAEMLIGGAVVETAYLNLTGAEPVERATVSVTGGETMTASVTTNESQTLSGELSYAWYVYDPTNTWYAHIASTGKTFTPTADDYEKAIKVVVFDDNGYAGTGDFWCSKLPVVYIDTDGVPVVSKDVDVAAHMTIQGNGKDFAKDKYLYDGELTMHVRGNSTAGAAKKPYKIKLDSKTNLLNMGKNKHWVLLSNPIDFSLLRNKTAYDLSGAMGLTYME